MRLADGGVFVITKTLIIHNILFSLPKQPSSIMKWNCNFKAHSVLHLLHVRAGAASQTAWVCELIADVAKATE